MRIKPATILLVDDNPADSDLISELLQRSSHKLQVSTVADGEQAMAFLRRQGRFASASEPDLMLLDLNMPRKDGRAVLAEVRSNPALRTLPIVVFTTSQARYDIQRSYELGANCYVSKPGSLQDFVAAVKGIADFWLGEVRLPNGERG
jgi:two-component system, chemotaxis family, response regulator Rcp1